MTSLAGGAFGAETEPLHIAIVSRYSQALVKGKEIFDKRHGPGLIELHLGETGIDAAVVQRSHAVVLHYAGVAAFTNLAPAVRAMTHPKAVKLAIPADNIERLWGVKPAPALQARAERYWLAGGAENLASFLAVVYQAAGGTKRLEVPEPQADLTSGIWHPRAPGPFTSAAAFRAWHASRRTLPETAPIVAVMFYSNHYKFGDLAHITALVDRLEANGLIAMPVFGWPVTALEPLLQENGRPVARVILAANLGFGKPEDAAVLGRLGAPVVNLLVTRDDLPGWEASDKGISPDRVSNQLNSPERMGANEPILFAATEKVEGSEATRSVPIPERVELAVKRAQRWLALQDKPNAEKRVAFIYYSNPPGKGFLGASYLNLMPSLMALTRMLDREGYHVGPLPQTEKKLVALLHRTGRNIEQWAPGELEELAEQGITLIPLRKYRRWYATLPERFRQQVEKVWGPPEESRLMTLTPRNGEKLFVLPGVRAGNVFLGPQPLRNSFERATQTQHDVLTPPPHAYIAAYLWYRFEFKADAVVHMGRHGTLEWLPGKHVGQAAWDSSEALLGDLPNPYYFIIDGGGEAIQARRRSAGVMIGHLTPMIVPAGEQSDMAELDRLIEQWEQVHETNAALGAEYQKQALAEIRKLKLQDQLAIRLEAPWEEVVEKVHRFIHEVEDSPAPMGQQTVGSLPAPAVRQEALAEFLRSNFQEGEGKKLEKELESWAEALMEGGRPAVGDLQGPLRAKVERTLAEGKEWLKNLEASGERETRALAGILNGRYHESGMLGDPLRNPASMPSGRNLHDFDTALIPTKAACEVGKRMAAQTVERFKAEKGRYPEKISMVLWYGETGRSHGAMECEAMYLLGVEPKWNPRGIVDGLRLIPEGELGRPRVDVLFTVSGIYRDGFGDKALWLDKAVRLAATAPGKNAVREHDEETARRLQAQGIEAGQARDAAQARVFGAAPGMYGVGGIAEIVSQSLDDAKEKGLGDMYLHHMNHAYSAKLWGKNVAGNLNRQMEGNDAIVHSRTTFVYGVLDNDDFYQFAGGLNSASKLVNGGAVPELYVNNLRSRGRERIETFRNFLVTELSGRLWNPRWIEAQKDAGYAGARQFVKEMEHLYGWQATSKEHVNEELWQRNFDVYVADKHGLKLNEFFERENPHARQWILTRLLEIDRQGTHRFSAEDRNTLVREYVQSVNAHGAACHANSCGNLRLHQYVAMAAGTVPGLGSLALSRFAASMAKSTHWTARDFPQVSQAFRQGLAQAAAARAARQEPSARAEAAGKTDERPQVKGYRMDVTTLTQPARRAMAGLHWNAPTFGALLALVLVGLWWERRKEYVA